MGGGGKSAKSSNNGNDSDNDSVAIDSGSEFVVGIMAFIGALITLFLRLIQLIAVVFSWLFFIASVSPYIFISFGLVAVTIPYVYYQDVMMEEFDYFMRCLATPYYHGWPRELLLIVQQFYEPLICWWNSVMWLPYGIVQKVIIPLFLHCGIKTVFLNAGHFVLVFFVDFVINYILSFQFYYGDFDYTASGTSFGAFWASWQATLTCACEDLEPFVKAAWIITIIPPVIPVPANVLIGIPTSMVTSLPYIANVFYGPILGVIGGNQMGDFNTWCAVWSAFNGIMNIVQQFLRIIVAVITGQFGDRFPRPDFRQAVNNFCQSVSCAVRSIENVNQFLFDSFIPFDLLDWHEFLCVYDSVICVLLHALDNILRILINIDRVVMYPSNPFYADVIVPDFIHWINLIAPPRYQTPTLFNASYPVAYTSWLWPTTSSLIPGTLLPNPVYQVNRFSDCLCIYLRRLICDPSDVLTPCFNSQVSTIFGPFNVCCGIYEILTLAVDVVAALFDISRHVYDFNVFMNFINNQYFTTTIAVDQTAVIHCVFNVFAIIPVVGPCLSIFFTGLAQAIFQLQDFAIRMINGLVFLPYYIINNLPNFVINRGQALFFATSIINQLTNATLSNSTVNCGCFVLNSIIIPPIPCSTCIPGGFITPVIPPPNNNYPNRGGGAAPIRVASADGAGLDYNDSKPFSSTKSTNAGSFASSAPPTTEGAPAGAGAPKLNVIKRLREFSMTPNTHEELKTYLENRKNAMDKRIADIINQYRRQEPKNGSYTLTPTSPPTALTCSNPTPACLDVACGLRAAAALIYAVTFHVNNAVNSLAQDWDIGFPFFVNGNVSICSAMCPTQNTTLPCTTACPGINISFEQTLANVITAAVGLVRCVCEIVNEVIPITGFPSVYTERPDICCWVVRVGDLVAASLLLLIRAIKALATGNVSPPGTPPFPYFTQGQFIMDVDQIFEIALDVVICLGFMIRSIFPVATFADLDVYCPVQNIATFLLAQLMWVVNIIISLGTIQYTIGQDYFIDPNCNWEARGCTPIVTHLPFIRDGNYVIDSFFGKFIFFFYIFFYFQFFFLFISFFFCFIISFHLVQQAETKEQNGTR